MITTNQFVFIGGIIFILFIKLPTLEKRLLPPAWRESLGNKIFHQNSETISWGKWITDSLNFFDKLFSRKHLSWRCFGTSAVFTILGTIAGFLMIGVIWDFSNLRQIGNILLSVDNVRWVVAALLVNIIIDYFSLLETRYVIGWIQQDYKFPKILVLLTMDLLFSFLIFVLLFSLFKSILDFSRFLPVLYKYQHLDINHGPNLVVSLNTKTGLLHCFVVYFISIVKYCVWVSYELFQNSLREYWFVSLYLADKKQYVLHGSTMWLTTHLTSIYIYFYLLFRLLTQINLLHRIPFSKYWYQKFFTLFNQQGPDGIQPKENPVTLIICHLGLYSLIGWLFFCLFQWMKNL